MTPEVTDTYRKEPAMPKVSRPSGLTLAAGIVLGLLAASAPARAQAANPVEFGRLAVNEALAARGLKASVEIKVVASEIPESYTITFAQGTTQIRAPTETAPSTVRLSWPNGSGAAEPRP